MTDCGADRRASTSCMLEYSNADCRLHHIHEHDVTSSLKGKREKTFRREKGKRPLDLFSSGFFSFGRIHQK